MKKIEFLKVFLFGFLIASASCTCSDFLDSLEERNYFLAYSQSDARVPNSDQITQCRESAKGMSSFTILGKQGVLKTFQVCLPQTESCKHLTKKDLEAFDALLHWDITDNGFRMRSQQPSSVKVKAENIIWMVIFAVYIVLVLGFTFMPRFQRSYVDLDGVMKKKKSAFNIKENILELFAAAPKEQLSLSGFSLIKILASYWVVAFHTFMILHAFGFEVQYDASSYAERTIIMLMESGGLIVEYFFMMTGFFGAYSLIPKINRSSFLGIMRHRWERIVPLMFVAYMFFYMIGPFLNSGNMWVWLNWKAQQCQGQWWGVLIPWSTYSKGGANEIIDCMGHIWYIPVDFVLYIIVVGVCFLYAKKGARWGKLCALALVIFGLIYRISSLSLVLSSRKVWWLNFVTRSPNFAHGCFSGVLWGMYYREYRNGRINFIKKFEEKVKPYQAFIVLVLAVFLNLTVMLWWDKVETVLPDLPIWGTVGVNILVNSIALCVMVLATQKTLFVQKFVSLRIFQILGKTSYSFYLLNDLFLWVVSMNDLLGSEGKETLTLGRVIGSTIKSLVCCQVSSLVWYVLFEKPLSQISIFEYCKKLVCYHSRKKNYASATPPPPS